MEGARAARPVGREQGRDNRPVTPSTGAAGGREGALGFHSARHAQPWGLPLPRHGANSRKQDVRGSAGLPTAADTDSQPQAKVTSTRAQPS